MKKITPDPPRLFPLNCSADDTPVLLINADAPLSDLHAFACRRIDVARRLVQTLSCTAVKHTDDSDLRHVCDALYVLLEEGSEVMGVIGRRVMALGYSVADG